MSTSVTISQARPYAFRFAPASTALVLIDFQRDFLEPGGFGASLGNDVATLAPAIPATRRLLTAWRRHGLFAVHTREGHRADLSDCPSAKRMRGREGLCIGDPGPMGRILIQGEPGHAIIPELAPISRELVIDKPGKGAFHATALDAELRRRGITSLLFTGVTTEVCVQTTMREANDRGYECLLVEDATDSYFPEFKAATLAMVRAQGAIVGWTATVEQVIGALDA